MLEEECGVGQWLSVIFSQFVCICVCGVFYCGIISWHRSSGMSFISMLLLPICVLQHFGALFVLWSSSWACWLNFLLCNKLPHIFFISQFSSLWGLGLALARSLAQGLTRLQAGCWPGPCPHLEARGPFQT